MLFIKNKIYIKLFFTYTVVTVFLIVSFNLYFIQYEKNTILNQSIYSNKLVLENLNDKINAEYNYFNETLLLLYSNINIVDDLIVFLNNDINSYTSIKLDILSENNKLYHNGIERFIYSIFDSNENLSEVSLISNNRQEQTTITNKKHLTVYQKNDSNNHLFDSDNKILLSKSQISFIRELTNPLSLDIEGKIIFTFNTDMFNKIISNDDASKNIIITDENGLIIYNYNNKYDNIYYPNHQTILFQKEKPQKNDNIIINTLTNQLGFTIFGEINIKDVSNLNLQYYLILLLIDFIVFALSQLIIYYKIRKMQNRMDCIVKTMKKVEIDGTNVKIPITSENDELNYISERFNNMCEKLDEYIKKSYISEISQKNLEIQTLQSKINPHFLYNTLECIRMKAICNDDRDVAQMLYLLANLFRSQLKDKDIITIETELLYCKEYIELLKFRYPNKFDYLINCPHELLKQPIIKFILQPLIENYFIHGIRSECDDNYLSIELIIENHAINIKISDNGKGITPEKQIKIQNSLNDSYLDTNLIGISNVNERVILSYGNDYGLSFKSDYGKGTTITLRIPMINEDF